MSLFRRSRAPTPAELRIAELERQAHTQDIKIKQLQAEVDYYTRAFARQKAREEINLPPEWDWVPVRRAVPKDAA